jgi:hypothetical protein
MSTPIIVTDRATLEETVADVVQRVMLESVPDVLREAEKPDWMSRDEVCEVYGLTARQLTYMREKNSVEFSQHGRRILYNRESLEEWIDEGRVQARRGTGSKQEE